MEQHSLNEAIALYQASVRKSPALMMESVPVDSNRGVTSRGNSPYDKFASPETRAKVLESRMQEIAAFAQSRSIPASALYALAEAAMRTGKIPDLGQFGLAGDDAVATKQFMLSNVLNLAGLEWTDYKGDPVVEEGREEREEAQKAEEEARLANQKKLEMRRRASRMSAAYEESGLDPSQYMAEEGGPYNTGGAPESANSSPAKLSAGGEPDSRQYEVRDLLPKKIMAQLREKVGDGISGYSREELFRLARECGLLGTEEDYEGEGDLIAEAGAKRLMRRGELVTPTVPYRKVTGGSESLETSPDKPASHQAAFRKNSSRQRHFARVRGDTTPDEAKQRAAERTRGWSKEEDVQTESIRRRGESGTGGPPHRSGQPVGSQSYYRSKDPDEEGREGSRPSGSRMRPGGPEKKPGSYGFGGPPSGKQYGYETDQAVRRDIRRRDRKAAKKDAKHDASEFMKSREDKTTLGEADGIVGASTDSTSAGSEFAPNPTQYGIEDELLKGRKNVKEDTRSETDKILGIMDGDPRGDVWPKLGSSMAAFLNLEDCGIYRSPRGFRMDDTPKQVEEMTTSAGMGGFIGGGMMGGGMTGRTCAMPAYDDSYDLPEDPEERIKKLKKMLDKHGLKGPVEDKKSVKEAVDYEPAPNADRHPGFRDEGYDSHPSRFMDEGNEDPSRNARFFPATPERQMRAHVRRAVDRRSRPVSPEEQAKVGGASYGVGGPDPAYQAPEEIARRRAESFMKKRS